MGRSSRIPSNDGTCPEALHCFFVARYKIDLNGFLPPLILRVPFMCPLSHAEGATPSREAACDLLRLPRSGIRLMRAMALRFPIPVTAR